MLESNRARGFSSSQSINYIIRLDEGHSRPCWEWVKHPKNAHGRRFSALVPQMPDTMLIDALSILAADGIEDPAALEALDRVRHCRHSLVDFNLGTVPEGIHETSARALRDFKINVVRLPSSYITNADDLVALGLDVRFLS